MPALRRPGRVFTAALAGLLLALTGAVPPAHGDTAATGEIAGSLGDGGQPVAGATVEAVDFDYPYTDGVSTALTDAAGSFRLTGLPAGKWWLRTTLPGGWMIQYYPAKDATTTATAITVTAGKVETVRETVLTHGALTGLITTSTGAPAAGAVVTVPHPARTMRTTAGADGRYLFDYLPPTTLLFFFARDLYAPAQTVTATVLAGQRVTVDQQLAPAGAITGSYTSAAGPIHAVVTAYADGTAGDSAVTSETDGTFTLWLTPGKYTVRFDSVSDDRDQWATAATSEADAEVFTVAPEQVISHAEQLAPHTTITG
ncbi:MAG TPA: carboxypeptidase-like regulatory domain-containing protein [Actinoplanes sp.]|jgi:hypothetical protein